MPPTSGGHGANTVNVLLVDIRAWDTLGEVSVLIVAATGVASLVFRHRRARLRGHRSIRWRPPRMPVTPAVAYSPQPETPLGCAAVDARSLHRSLVLEVATRDDLPADHGAVGILLLHGPQHARRWFCGWADGPGWRWCCATSRAAGTNWARPCRSMPGRSSVPAWPLSSGTALGSSYSGAPVLSSAVISGEPAVAGFGQVCHRLILRPGRLLDRGGSGARCAAQPRARIDTEMADAVNSQYLSCAARHHRRSDQQRCISCCHAISPECCWACCSSETRSTC